MGFLYGVHGLKTEVAQGLLCVRFTVSDPAPKPPLKPSGTKVLKDPGR